MLIVAAALLLFFMIVLSEREEGKRILYFAYGANTNERFFKKRIPSAVYKGTGTLSDHTVQMHRYAALVPAKGSIVKGVVWSLFPSDLFVLDDIEEGYSRNLVTIVTKRSKKAQTYFMKTLERGEASEEYTAIVKEGYRKHGLPLDQINWTPLSV